MPLLLGPRAVRDVVVGTECSKAVGKEEDDDDVAADANVGAVAAAREDRVDRVSDGTDGAEGGT